MSEAASVVELSVDTNESFLLGEESLRVEDPGMRRFGNWRIAKGGVPHPQVCPTCGRVTKRWPTDVSHFVMDRQDLDMSWTYDGYLFVHDVTLGMFKDLGVTLPDFGFWKKHVAIIDVGSMPVCNVDTEASKVRQEDFCSTCQNFAVVLKGRTSAVPPQALPLVIASEVGPRELRATDFHFGSTHEQSPALIAGHELWKEMQEWKM